MGTLLPERHPNRDFFIVDLSDANPRDDMASMEHPVFSLSVKPDMRELEYTAPSGKRLRVVPSGKGLATIMDKDIVLYCISKLVGELNRGFAITPTVELSAHEVMVACNWNTENKSYKRFEDALIRLRGTTIVTDIETARTEETEGFGLIDSFKILRQRGGKPSAFGRLSKVEITLSSWTFRAIQAMEVLKIDRQYFRLRRPLERRLYEVARKHVGDKNEPWKIGIEKLRAKVGTNAPLKKFRFNLKEIMRDGNLPEYGFVLDGDLVVFQRLCPSAGSVTTPVIPLRGDTLDKAQRMAAELRLSVSDLVREWTEWTHEKGTELGSPDAAFIAFCKQKVGSRAGSQMSAALGEAQQLGLAIDRVMPAKKRA